MENDIIEYIEKLIFESKKETGSFTLFEIDSELNTPMNLLTIKNYLYEMGYIATFDNSDVYRLMYIDIRKN